MLTSALGASIASCLAVPFLADSFWFGLAMILLAQACMSLLSEVFRLDIEPLLENETRKNRRSLRNNALYVSIASLTIIGFIAFLLFANNHLSVSSFLFLLLCIVIVLIYSIPPFRFVNRGFGEFLLRSEERRVGNEVGS